MASRRFFWCVSIVLLLAALRAPAMAGVAARTGATLTVTSTADAGPGTLRQALLDALRGDTIEFDATVFPPATPATIALVSPLPALTQGYITLDGHGAGVIIDGSGTPTDTVGILIESSGNGVRIADEGTDGATVSGNYIGLDAAGAAALANGEHGVEITNGAAGSVIGGTSSGAGNAIAGNGRNGVSITGAGSTGNRITRNSLSANDGNGIDTAGGGNLELTPPAIEAAEVHLVGSSVVSGTACAGCAVEVFTDPQDEGRRFWGSATADAGGRFVFSGHIAGAYLTATATDAAGNTSEFSMPFSFTPPRGYLPLFYRAY